MNWITTNVRIPEDIYMDLKMRAARERRSISSLIREKITQPSQTVEAGTLLTELELVNKQMAKAVKGKNLTSRLIKSRYKHV